MQLGDTGENRDAWMVGYTPSMSTAVWVGTTEGTKPLENKWGSPIYGSGLPSDIWKTTMDGALEDTEEESFPKPEEIGGYAGAPQAPPPPATPTAPPPPSETVIQPTIEVAPGITIPLGPPTTVPLGPPTPVGGPGAGRRPRAAGRTATGTRRSRGSDAGSASAPVTEPDRETVSPTALAPDRRSLEDRDLPSRTDTIGAALSGVIGGPVGRHALIGSAAHS